MDNRIDVQIWLSTKQACRFLNKRLAPIIKINERVLVDLTYNNHFNRYFNLHGDYYMSGVYYSIEDIHAMFCFAIGLNTTVFAMDYESDTPLKTKIMLADGVYKVNDICEPPDDYKDKPAIVIVDGGGSVFAVYELADKNSNILLSTLNIEIQNNIERVKKYGINPFSLPLSEGKIVYKRDELERFIKAQTEPADQPQDKPQRPTPISSQHRENLLRRIKAEGLDALQLTAGKGGKSGSKAQIKALLVPNIMTNSQFEKTWESAMRDQVIQYKP